MSIIYGVVFFISLVMVGAYLWVDKGNSVPLLMLSVSIAVCDLGHFLISISKTLNGALWANRLAYLGQVFLPLFILVMILQVCGVVYPKWLPWALTGLSLAVLAVVVTPGVLPWYYTSADIITVDGATQIVRTYGPLHVVYNLYIFGYAAADAAVIFLSMSTGSVRMREYAFLLLAAIYSNVVVWAIEGFMARGFEILTISYVITEAFVLIITRMCAELEVLRTEAEKRPHRSLGHFSPEDIVRVFETCPQVDALTPRERDILRYLLSDTPRKEIAEELCLSESSVKKHTGSIFQKMGVSDRKELLHHMSEFV